MRLTVVGCGDAFGSGGRLQTCYHFDVGTERFLIDCGATALIGHARLGLDPNAVGTILISHLHGDHFAGLIWWLMHARYVAKRKAPLLIAGPPGIEERVRITGEALFPGSTTVPYPFSLSFGELTPGPAASLGGIEVEVAPVHHPSGAPSYAMRCAAGGRTVAFSGDTEWVDVLIEISRGADLYLTECYGFDRAPPYHISWPVLSAKLPLIAARRVMLTHMSEPMLANRHVTMGRGLLLAEDGMVVDI
jgi:ribonuclease BN (tRNA processing enzyme)